MGILRRSHSALLVKGLFAALAISCLVGLYYGYRLMVSNEASRYFGRTVERLQAIADDIAPIHVVVVTSNVRLGGAIAVMMSVTRHTRRPVRFHLVTDNATKYHAYAWMHHPHLSGINYEVLTFPNEAIDQTLFRTVDDSSASKLTFAKLYMTHLLPSVSGIVVQIDDDVIVQGDIGELAGLPISQDHVGLFSQDCDAVSRRYNSAGSKYSHYLNLDTASLAGLHINPGACVLNIGVFVINMEEWKRQNITAVVEHWMRVDQREKIFKQEGPLCPLLLALYNKTTTLDPQWHVRNLGVTTGSLYSRTYIEKAKLLQWSGHFKPWGTRASFADIWYSYFVADPTGRFRPSGKYSRISTTPSGSQPKVGYTR
ncbi:glycosyltransferase 8 domain-containing protein 1-like isoform X2 [Ornithodoros turicata]|uniref:glycosyltransferase 8 domain-containing protein 1-like isoform X2 n=1 Tax=Ornithodoros turicata TaxID=34597 RepID=UPI00313A33FC